MGGSPATRTGNLITIRTPPTIQVADLLLTTHVQDLVKFPQVALLGEPLGKNSKPRAIAIQALERHQLTQIANKQLRVDSKRLVVRNHLITRSSSL